MRLENWAYEIVSRHMSPAMNKVATFITRRGDTISVVLICLALIIILLQENNSTLLYLQLLHPPSSITC